MTPRGWRVIAAALAFWAAGRLLGSGELIQVGLMLGTLCLGALAMTMSAPRSLEIERHLPPDPIHAGSDLHIQLLIRNRHRLPTSLVRVVEPLNAPFGELSFLISIEGMKERLLRYRLTPPRRGRYELPPTRTTISDPFSIGQRVKEFGNARTLIVYPRVEALPPLEVISRRLTRSGRPVRVPGGGAEEFYAMRDYVSGDDPRRIHWRTSARVDRLMVREDESAGRERVTIFLDDRNPSYKGTESFEEAVSSSASAVMLYGKQGYLIRLLRVVGDPVPFGRGADHYREILETLALAQTHRGNYTLGILGRGSVSGGVLFGALGSVGPEDLGILASATRRSDETVFVLTSYGRVGRTGRRSSSVDSLRRAGALVIVVEPGQSMSAAWSAAIGDSAWRASAYT